jgi:hypothetical protein
LKEIFDSKLHSCCEVWDAIPKPTIIFTRKAFHSARKSWRCMTT